MSDDQDRRAFRLAEKKARRAQLEAELGARQRALPAKPAGCEEGSIEDQGVPAQLRPHPQSRSLVIRPGHVASLEVRAAPRCGIVATAPMIATFDISRISTTVRRHEALLRYARYLFIFNIVIFLWIAIPQLSQVTSFRGLTELVVGPAWQWAALVLGSVGATYLILAHRLWWAYAVIFLVQVGYFVFMPSPDKQVFLVSAFAAYGVITLPPMRPLAPLATELAIMNIGFGYIMIVYCLYSATWSVNGGRVPRGAYGRRLSPFEPLRPSRLLDTLLPGHRSQNVTLVEAALFALSSMLFVAASMAPFYGFRRVQNAFMTVAPQFLACAREGVPAQPAQATIACWAGYYPWSHAAIDLGAPLGITVVCLVLANRLRHFGRQHFIQRLAEAATIARWIDPLPARFSRRPDEHTSGQSESVLIRVRSRSPADYARRADA